VGVLRVIPVRNIHQIEVTSRCNLRCRYCIHPTMARPKVDMDRATFERALSWAARFKQRSINLAGIGESTMHPEFVDFVALTREALGPDAQIIIATNGLLVTDELAKALKPYDLRVVVSLHRPEKAGPAIEVLKRHGLIAGVSADPSLAATNWAGQVKWHVSTDHLNRECPWVAGGWAIVLSDGRLVPCAFDGNATSVLGTVWDDVETLTTAPHGLCASCDQYHPAAVRAQAARRAVA
jgi:hypothetical protein